MADTASMNGSSTASAPPADDRAAERAAAAAERAAIDTSCRLPVLVFFGSAIVWLILGSLFGVLSSVKLHSPYINIEAPWQTFGRTRTIHLNMVNYGWGSMAGIGVTLWMLARLGRTPLVRPKLLVLAAMLWNAGVLIGTLSLMAGYGFGPEWLEYPPWVPPFFIAALSIVSLTAISTFSERKEPHVYVTQWYAFGALFWMPWLYTVATIVIIYAPATGVIQSTTNWWFAHNVLGLWMTPIAVGAAYYLIPKVIGRPVYSYYLSIVGFWSLALFYSWAGMHHLIGGPIPPWMISASTVGSMMMLIPVIAVAINHHMTMKGNFGLLRYSPTLRFVVFGSITYTCVSVQGAFEALRDMSEWAHFTNYTVGHAHLGAYGFFAMIMFGSIYYIVPRLTGWEWASPRLISAHFWCTSIGIIIYFTGLSISGWYEGNQMNDRDYPFIAKAQHSLPYLITRSVGGSLMTLGHICFAVLFVMNILKMGVKREGPTFFRTKDVAVAPESAAPVAVS